LILLFPGDFFGGYCAPFKQCLLAYEPTAILKLKKVFLLPLDELLTSISQGEELEERKFANPGFAFSSFLDAAAHYRACEKAAVAANKNMV
jgi:hypothetical protein